MKNNEVFSKREKKELLVGVLVILIFTVYFMYLNSRKLEDVQSHSKGNVIEILAEFNKTDGLFVGSEVRLAGVDIGKVVKANLEDNFSVDITMQVFEDVKIPIDSSASINTSGLFGSKYIEIQDRKSVV